MDLADRIKELEAKGDYSGVLKELQKYQGSLASEYSRLSTILGENHPVIEGLMLSLEELSLSSTAILRKCLLRLEEKTIEAIPETEVSSKISSVETTTTRDRDNVFTLAELKDLETQLPKVQLTDEDKSVDLKFWYVKEGKSELIEINAKEKTPFVKILIQVLEKSEASDEKFSVSPLGFEALLKYQFESPVGQLLKTYDSEFTIIKLFA
ncbi:MAG: hypothetical protein ACTSW1_18730 [Candidatus Hodarchaeales archaeon]